MNHTVTMQKLEEMRFTGFARAYREMTETNLNREFTIDEVIAHLVQAEWDDRYNRKLQRLIQTPGSAIGQALRKSIFRPKEISTRISY